MTKTAEEVRSELEKRKKRAKGGKRPWISIEEGETYIRIGPPWTEDGEIWKDVFYHGGFKDKIYCGKNDIDEKTGKPGKCKACKAWEENKKERSAVAKELFSLLRQKSESIWNVLVAKIKKRDDGSIKVRKYEDSQFKLLRFSTKWQNMLLEIFSDDDYRKKSVLGVAHPKSGRLIRVKRTGKGMDDTDYHFKVIEKETPISESSSERHKLLKTLNDLDEIVTGSSPEEIDTFVHKMKKKAKRLAEENDDSDDSSDSSDASDKSDDSDASDKSDSSDKSDRSNDSSDGSEDENDLERQYRELKKQIKKKRKH